MKLVLLLLSFVTLAHGAEPRWWKGNLHTHSLWSDGDDFPEMIAAWYKDQGYNFLGLSDHNIIADREHWISIAKRKVKPVAMSKYKERFGEKWVELREVEVPEKEREKEKKDKDLEVRLKMLSEFRPALEEPGKFLMIPCEEITGEFLKNPIHINATNIQELIAPVRFPKAPSPPPALKKDADEAAKAAYAAEKKKHEEAMEKYTSAIGQRSSFVDVMGKVIDAVYAQRERLGVPMFPHINHPNFGWVLTAEDMAQVDRERFFEVYNGHPSVHNEGNKDRASTDRIWDVILTKRLAELGKDVVYGMGVDDSHAYHGKPNETLPPDPPKEPEKDAKPGEAAQDVPPGEPAGKETAPAAKAKEPAKPAAPSRSSQPGRGWIMVRSEKLDAPSLIAAMEAGDFYASSGVTLKDVARGKNRLGVEIDAEPGVTYTTEFIGTRKGYDGASEPAVDAKGVTLRTTRRYSKDVGAVLATVTGTSASYDFKGDEIYVRARVTSSKLKFNPAEVGEFERAWTQPVATGLK